VVTELGKKSFISAGFAPRKIDLNLAEIKDLTALPYLSYSLAKSITAWRFQHGRFRNPEELKQLVQMDDVTFQKIKPYLTVKE